MNRQIGWMAATLLACALSGSAAAANAACDTRCLGSLMERYLAQLLKHDPSPLPVAANALAIENANAVKLGEGSWTSVRSFPVPGHTFADGSTGQVAHYTATTGTDGRVGSLYVRLKIVDRKIAESEIFSRGAYTMEGMETVGLLEPDILYTAIVPQARRSTRERLIKIVDLYMDGISQHHGAVFPAGSRCDRYQAGNKFTNVMATMDRGGGTCQTSMNRLMGQDVVNKRFPIVDVERGIVVVHCLIPHAERNPQNATNVAEIFKIVDGKVRSIEEFSFVGGWPPSSGFPDDPAATVPPLVSAGGTLQKVAEGFDFTEGPAANLAGDVYFSDIPKNRIHKWDAATGKISLHRENTAKANGLMFDAAGRLVTCEMDNKRVVLDDLKGNISVLAEHYNGESLHMPNDLWIDAGGGVYFSDFEGPGAENLQVYYQPAGSKPLVRATTDLSSPNGLAGSLDGRLLYVTEPGTRKTWVYDIGADGALANKRLFVDDFADGFKLDEFGNLYFTGESIRIYSPSGRKLQEIATPERSTNLTFGGQDGQTLFITTMKSVHTLRMNVRGAPTPLERANGRRS